MEVCEELMKCRFSAGDDPGRKGKGVYAIFLREGASINGVSFGSSRLLYIGKSESSLKARNHFRYEFSSSSTLRRTLGALLKTELNLLAKPRKCPGKASDRDITNFRFDQEKKLTEWMEKNLEFNYVLIEDKVVSDIERSCISTHQPPLNLTLWKNKQSRFIKTLRKVCRDEARSNS
jgi:hypothetical protein